MAKHEQAVLVQYLEVVTPDVDATCTALEKVYGVSFGKPAAELGHARTAGLRGGGLIGVRAPMRGTEQPVVRPYALVENIAAAVEAAEAAGAELVLPPTEIPGRGKCAIYILGGIEYGLWQL
jgi:predicted enzyme related to lactoylglutathione lyase